MSELVIVVPAGRRLCGRALLVGANGSTRVGPLRVLATASAWAARRHGNEDRDWRRPYGHTPTGTYVIASSLPPGVAPRARHRRRFGLLGALVLEPIGGDALEAARLGRRRFLLHGGPSDGRGRLRPTFGGLRMADAELDALVRAVNDANAARDPVSVVQVVETTMPTWRRGTREGAGRLRPAFLEARQPRVVEGSIPVGPAALVALGFGLAGRGVRGASADNLRRPHRRDFVGLALLAIGALGASACGGTPDVPGPDIGGGPAGPGWTGGGAGSDCSGDDGGAPDAGVDAAPCGGEGYGGAAGDVGGDVGGDDTSGGGG